MKHFIAFATLGIAAVGSGMALAAHFALPCPEGADTTEFSPSMPISNGFSSPRLALPAQLPSSDETIRGAERAFGGAVNATARYSDQTFGPAAMKVKKTVDRAEVPRIN